MARLAFCFPLGWPSNTFAELDGHAEIDSSGEIIEIFLPDYAVKGMPEVTVTGALADQIERWLLIARGDEVVAATEEARRGRIASDREMYGSAAE